MVCLYIVSDSLSLPERHVHDEIGIELMAQVVVKNPAATRSAPKRW